jgi:hypothetical protein
VDKKLKIIKSSKNNFMNTSMYSFFTPKGITTHTKAPQSITKAGLY